MKPPRFEYAAPASVEEALPLLGDVGTVLAGGQSLVPMLNLRLAQPELVVDVNGLVELDYLRAGDGVSTNSASSSGISAAVSRL